MKKELVTELLIASLDNTHPENVSVSLSQQELERLIENVVDRCVTVLEQAIDEAMRDNDGELYASLVDTAFKIMDHFGIDELANVEDIVEQMLSNTTKAESRK